MNGVCGQPTIGDPETRLDIVMAREHPFHPTIHSNARDLPRGVGGSKSTGSRMTSGADKLSCNGMQQSSSFSA